MGAFLMVWPFGRTEGRAATETRADVNATDTLVAAMLAHASGAQADPLALAATEAAAGLWERSLASATVEPMNAALRPVNPDMLALIARGLAIRGEFVAEIMVGDDGLALLPASTWDTRGDADPSGWIYRCDFSGPSRTATRNLVAAAVVHVRIGADPRTPWRGRSPLARSVATARLAASIEAAMTADAKMPVGRLVPLASSTPERLGEMAAKIREGGINVLGTAGGPAAGLDQIPASRFNPQTYGPDPGDAFRALRTDVGREVLAAFGVPPALFDVRGDGAGQREAWRRYWLGTVAPIGRAIQTELRAKLDTAATVDFEALRASDEDARSRAVNRRAAAAKILVELGMTRDRALAMAGLRDDG